MVEAAPPDAHFLIGLCSFGPLPDPTSFVYVPNAANLLREREQHVQLLEQQLRHQEVAGRYADRARFFARSFSQAKGGAG